MEHKIKEAFAESCRVKTQFAEDNAKRMAELARLIVEAFTQGKKLLIFGNGGSATDASHIAAELVGRFKMERRGLPAIALGTDLAATTAIANDYGYEAVYARQIEALGSEGDMAIGLSTSGNSPNIIKAMETARKRGIYTVALTGAHGGRLAPLVDMAFKVPSDVTARIQESHITLGHVLCQLVEESLFKNHG